MTPIPADSAARGRRSPRRPYRFGTQEIASAAGRSIETIRKDRQRGILDPESLASVASYIARARGWMHLQIPDEMLQMAVITFFEQLNQHFTHENLPPSHPVSQQGNPPLQGLRTDHSSPRPDNGVGQSRPARPGNRQESAKCEGGLPEKGGEADSGNGPAPKGELPDQPERKTPTVLDAGLTANGSHAEASPQIRFPRWNRAGANLAYHFPRAGAAPIPYTRGQILSQLEVLKYQEGEEPARRTEELTGVLKLMDQK